MAYFGRIAQSSMGRTFARGGECHRVADFEDARKALRSFVEERDWDKFHNPKDLAVSLNVEAGELLEAFQWREHADAERVREELADVVMYAMLLADKSGFDLPQAILDKIASNAAKYPADKAWGRADKYDRL